MCENITKKYTTLIKKRIQKELPIQIVIGGYYAIPQNYANMALEPTLPDYLIFKLVNTFEHHCLFERRTPNGDIRTCSVTYYNLKNSCLRVA